MVTRDAGAFAGILVSKEDNYDAVETALRTAHANASCTVPGAQACSEGSHRGGFRVHDWYQGNVETSPREVAVGAGGVGTPSRSADGDWRTGHELTAPGQLGAPRPAGAQLVRHTRDSTGRRSLETSTMSSLDQNSLLHGAARSQRLLRGVMIWQS